MPLFYALLTLFGGSAKKPTTATPQFILGHTPPLNYLGSKMHPTRAIVFCILVGFLFLKKQA
jgi:hypothetical protein